MELDKKSAFAVILILFLIAQGYNILSYLISSIPGFLLALLLIVMTIVKWLIPIVPFIIIGLFLHAIITSAIVNSRKD